MLRHWSLWDRVGRSAFTTENIRVSRGFDLQENVDDDVQDRLHRTRVVIVAVGPLEAPAALRDPFANAGRRSATDDRRAHGVVQTSRAQSGGTSGPQEQTG